MWEESQAAKRVRRADVYSSPSSSPEPYLLDAFRAQRLDYIIDETSIETATVEAQTWNEHEGGAFNLFASCGNEVDRPATIVRLRSPSPVADAHGLLSRKGHKARSAGPVLSEKLLEQYSASAITGDMVRQQSKLYCPGLAYGWKVTVLTTGPQESGQVAAAENTAENRAVLKRTRMGKRGRIKKRRKVVAEVEQKAQAMSARETEERLQREKKARRNRDKKFKKRARDKAKKEEKGEGHEAAEPVGIGNTDDLNRDEL